VGGSVTPGPEGLAGGRAAADDRGTVVSIERKPTPRRAEQPGDCAPYQATRRRPPRSAGDSDARIPPARIVSLCPAGSLRHPTFQQLTAPDQSTHKKDAP